MTVSELSTGVDGGLDWGRHYLMCPPTHFEVSYAINPWMRDDDRPDRERAHDQWHALVSTLESAGAQVSVIDPLAGLPDMVFAMNLGLVDASADPARAVVSRFRYPERRPEAEHARAWFGDRGFTLAEPAVAHEHRFEPGDAFRYGDALVYGHGFRSGPEAWEAVGAALGVRTVGVRLVDPLMYHLDLAFCPLDHRSAIVAPDALGALDAARLLRLVPDPLVLDRDEALTFAANSVVVGRTVVMPRCPDRVRAELERRGFAVEVVDVSEFEKAGGAVRCLTNPLDLSLAPARLAG